MFIHKLLENDSVTHRVLVVSASFLLSVSYSQKAKLKVKSAEIKCLV
jgi:hypothetical protein